MGWTFYDRRPAEPREELRRLCTWTNESGERRVIADSMVGSTWYAAVEHVKPDGSRIVWAAVFLTSRRDGWGYKDMDETCGPNESECPARILALLTPLADPEGRDKYAAAWRERCRANLEAKKARKPVKAGDVVKFAAPYIIGGASVDTFRAVERLRRGRKLLAFQTLDGCGPYRLVNWRKNVAA